MKNEMILKSSLDSIPSPLPTEKIQILGGNFFALLPQVTFPAKNLNFD